MSDDEERVTMPFKFVTAGFDARFPNQNQTKHCWQNYVDYHKCINAKGEDCRRRPLTGCWARKAGAARCLSMLKARVDCIVGV